MSVSLVTALAKHLNVDDSEAADTLRSVATELRRALDETGRIEIPSIGVFFRENGGIEFEPDEALVRAANLDIEGLGTVSFPGRTGASHAAPAEPSADEEAPVTPTLDVPTELPEFVEEPPEPSFLEAEIESFTDVGSDELLDADVDAVLEPGPEEPDGPEEDFVAPPPPPDPVAYWAEDEYDSEEVEDEAVSFEQEVDEPDTWQDADEPVSPLGATAVEPTFETPEFDVVPPEDEPPVIAPPPEPASPEPVHPTQRADRPPERHARPQEVIEERPTTRRRSLVPILVIGAILLLGLAVAAYYVILRGPEAPAVAVEETPQSTPTEFAPDTAAVAGGLSDSLATPPTGAPSETVAEATDAVDAEPEPEPEREPERPVETSAIDVAGGGWTVVVGSAATPGEARQIADRFRSLGYAPAVLYGSYGGVTRYRVVVRQFATEAEAQAFLRTAPQGLPSDAWRLPVTSEFEVIPRQ